MTPILFLNFALALTIGGYKSEIVNEYHIKLLDTFTTDTNSFLQKNGYNGIKHKFIPSEVLSQVVSGKNYVMKVAIDSETTVCLKIYDKFGTLSLDWIKLCSSLFDVI